MLIYTYTAPDGTKHPPKIIATQENPDWMRSLDTMKEEFQRRSGCRKPNGEPCLQTNP